MKRSQVILFVLGLAFLGVLIAILGPSEIATALFQVNPLVIPVLILLQILWMIFSTLALSFLLPPILIRNLFVVMSRAALLSMFGPLATGEGSLLYLLKREGIPLPVAGKAILVDRIVTAFCVILCALAVTARVGVISAAVVTSAIGVLLVAGAAATWISGSAIRNRIVLNFAATVIRIPINGIFFYLLFASMSPVGVTFIDATLISISLSLFNIVPVPGGLGVLEGGAAAVFSLVGVPPNATVAIYIVARISTYIGTALLASIARSEQRGQAIWDERTGDYTARTSHNPVPDRLLSQLESRLLVDLGAGTGATLPWVEERAQYIIALDISRSMLSQIPPAANRSSIQASAAQLPLKAGSIDAIFSYTMFCQLETNLIRPAWSEASRVLKAGGRFLQASPQRYSFYYPCRKLMELTGLYVLGWCHHTTRAEAERDGRAVGLKLVDWAVIEKQPSGSTPMRLLVARAASMLDRVVMQVFPQWGGELIMIFEKADG